MSKKSTLKSNIKRISKAQSPKLAQGWGRGMGITTQIPRNLSVRQWREHCHIDFLLRIHVTKMLQGIYISLRSAGNLFSGRCAHAILFSKSSSSPPPLPPPLIKNGMGRPLPQIHLVFTHFKFKVSTRVG